MIDEHGRVPSIELNSSHRSRPGAQERLGLRRRTTSFATGATGHDEIIPRANACTGAAPVAVPNQGELRTSGVCLSACHAGNIPDDVVNVQSGTRPPAGTAEAASCSLTPFNVSHNCAENVTVGVEDKDFRRRA